MDPDSCYTIILAADSSTLSCGMYSISITLCSYHVPYRPLTGVFLPVSKTVCDNNDVH